jgi:LAO/AO transport system kinase
VSGKEKPGDPIEGLAAAVIARNRRSLARAITLIESTREDHQTQAQDLLRRLAGAAGRTIRVGISGTPGVGKSTFIEVFGLHLTAAGHRVAVLAVDPSSRRSGGSILGDKTRMEQLARDQNAFIRPSPTGGTLGGVARRTRESMLAVEAAGFDVVLVETVGVGQSETAVADMVDFFLLLQAPGGGDELQGIKRGIMELADLLVVNKADGDLKPAATRAAADYRAALSLIRPKSPLWTAEVVMISALTGDGVADVWQRIEAFRAVVEADGAFAELRADQARQWMWSEVSERLVAALRAAPDVAARMADIDWSAASQRLDGAEALA